MLAAEAERLADLTELAARCSECFARARCAGCDLRAIAPLAKAALALGAPQEWLYPDAPPCRTDAEYLDEAVAIRVAIRLRGRQAEDLIEPAVEQAEMAARAMRAALMARPPTTPPTRRRCRCTRTPWPPATSASRHESG